MKLKKLEIRRTESYATPANVLQGIVTLQGETGQQDIVLSAGAISRLISVISDEVAITAKNNAKMASNAMKEACDEVLLLESDGAV
jgi:hypothetical protein